MKRILKRDLNGVRGDLRGVRGDLSRVWGDLIGVTGDLSGVTGDIDACELTAAEREAGVVIDELLIDEA